MKKWMLIIALSALVVWGIVDLTTGSKADSSVNDKSSETEDLDVEIGLNWGNRAPDFVLPSMDGKEIKLSDFRGKRVMMNFWASWCPPCVDEMPDLQQYYNNHQDDDFVVLGINLLESEMSRGNVESFIDEFELTFPVVLDGESFAAALYQVRNIPTTYILNSDGIIEEKIIGPMTYEMMDELMRPIE